MGYSSDVNGVFLDATEWSGGKIVNLGGLPASFNSVAASINDRGQAVGYSSDVNGLLSDATEWSGGSVINLGGLPGATSSGALGINDAGQVVGYSVVGGVGYATEWSGGNVINLGALRGATSSVATAINDAGQVVGSYIDALVEWSGGSVINLGGRPGATNGSASGINNAGQVVGTSVVGGVAYATEWSGGNVINLGRGRRTAASLFRPFRGPTAEPATTKLCAPIVQIRAQLRHRPYARGKGSGPTNLVVPFNLIAHATASNGCPRDQLHRNDRLTRRSLEITL